MQAGIIDLYEVTGDTDKTEGRGGSYKVGTYLDRSDAELAARGHGVMGSPGYIHKKSIVLFEDGTAYELGQEVKNFQRTLEQSKLRSNALKKLSEEERKALGI